MRGPHLLLIAGVVTLVAAIVGVAVAWHPSGSDSPGHGLANDGQAGGPSGSAPAGASANPSAGPSGSAAPSASPKPTTSRPGGGIDAPAPATFGFPDASTTGIPAGKALTKVSTDYYIITTAGTVIDGWDFPGQVEIRANNVTIKNSRVRCANSDNCVTLMPGYKGMHLSHLDIGLDSGWGGAPFGVMMSGSENSPSAVNNNILEYLHIHNVGDGLRVDGNFTLRYSFIHALDITDDGAHSDGAQTFGGPWALFYHNTIEGGNTSTILVQGGQSSNWVIDDNLLLGRRAAAGITSFAIGFDKSSCPAGGCKFINNHVNRTWEVDVSYDRGPWNSGNWYGNVYQDNGETVPVPN